jgi:mannose-6-phosphate isomerase-like protein (cupin superfamily)
MRSETKAGSRPPVVRHVSEVRGVPCPCGSSRRVLSGADSEAASLHVVEIREAKVHYHKETTEYYYILEGEGALELEGERVPVRAGSAAYIPPGVRHRAIGDLVVLNVVIPPFRPGDEFLA